MELRLCNYHTLVGTASAMLARIDLLVLLRPLLPLALWVRPWRVVGLVQTSLLLIQRCLVVALIRQPVVALVGNVPGVPFPGAVTLWGQQRRELSQQLPRRAWR